ncbi:hypothetical protein PB01_03720 [Psychrobacillus glaciei]|uniref:SbsC C-terminal domain-containing protein n=1 Tax=Psychrobacillus glaciei TaxID=2283160 RepID=A0A5J6SJ35_9BACI|nr:hypothetical protein [Psychrobacillus glaciei]QFF97996.1 hypothetical protein PB01_03720 [Psychrobacillus glaciei]
MNNKTVKIIVSSAIAASAFVSAGISQQAEAAKNIDALVIDAQKAGTVLKWTISIEGTADGVTQPWAQFDAAKDAIAKVEASLNGASYSDKLKYDALLIEPKTQLQRAQGYLDAITASAKIKEKTKALTEAVPTNNLDQVEAAYHAMTAEFRKQTILLDRVYGQSTRDRIRNVVKGPAEELINYLKNDVTAHMFTKAAATDIKFGRIQEATNNINQVQALINTNTLLWGSLLKKNLDAVNATQPVQMTSISRVDSTTVTIKLNRAVSSVQVSEFAFDNALSVSKASLSNDGTTVTLTTSIQTPGVKYTVQFKGNSASFTAPGSVVPIQIGDQTIQHRETTEVLSMVANFSASNNQPSRATVRVDIPAGIKVVSVNGIENNISGARSINITPEKNGNVTIAFTAKDANIASIDNIITFNRMEGSTVVESKSSAKLNFYAPAKAGTFSNKKIYYVDVINNYFVTSDGMKYKLRTSGDIYRNEGIAIGFDSFKSALDVEDTISGTYQPTAVSTFEITSNFYFVDLWLDSKFAYRSGTAGYRLDASRIDLNGMAQPNYEIIFYKNGAYIGKTKVNTNGVWNYSTNLDQNAISDYSFIQQDAGKAVPTTPGWEAKTLRVVEGSLDLFSISAGTTEDDNLTNEAFLFTVAPLKNKNGLVLAQDQVVALANASVVVQDNDGTKIRFTNNQDNTKFTPVSDGFQLNFGTIDPGKGSAVTISYGKDGLLSGPLKVISIDGIQNAYGLDMNIGTGFQITGY